MKKAHWAEALREGRHGNLGAILMFATSAAADLVCWVLLALAAKRLWDWL